MSLALAVLYESNWLQEDGAKLFFFGSCFLVLLVFGHFISKRSEARDPQPRSPEQLPETPDPPEATQPESNENALSNENAGEDAEDSEDSDWLPPARTVSFSLREIRFKGFELYAGPENSESFCDTASVEINYQRGIMPWDFTVATPKGLEARLDQKKDWSSVFLPQQTLVVSSYDAERIEAALLQEIKTSLESVPEEVAEGEMKAADPAT